MAAGFICVLIGAAGIVGGIEKGSMAGTITAAVIHIGGIIGMAIAKRMEGGETDEDEGDDSAYPGSSSFVDKPYDL